MQILYLVERRATIMYSASHIRREDDGNSQLRLTATSGFFVASCWVPNNLRLNIRDISVHVRFYDV